MALEDIFPFLEKPALNFNYILLLVVSSIEEPIPGWIDNFNGPVGMFVASGLGNIFVPQQLMLYFFFNIKFLKGILRAAHGDPNVCLDYMPVDVCVKGMITAAYKKCLEGHQ